jgi:hypothetical protein
VLWIRIRNDPHHFGNLNPHPDPHQIKIRIRIKIYMLDPEPDQHPHQFLQMSAQNAWNMSLF